MDWDNLRLLLAVDRAGSLRGAAKALGLDPSTVSRRLQHMEESLKAPLIERSGAHLQLTASGRALSQTAKLMETQLHAVTRSIHESTDAPTGQVRVSFPQILGRPVQQLLAQVPAKYPGLSLELCCSDRLLSLAAGEAEVIVRMAESPPPELVGVRLGALRLGLYSSQAYAARAQGEGHVTLEAPGHRWVDWGPAFARKGAMKWLDDTHPQRKVTARGDSGQAVFDAIEADMGIGVLAALYAQELVSWQQLPRELCPAIWLLSTREARTRRSVAVVLQELKLFSSQFAPYLYSRSHETQLATP